MPSTHLVPHKKERRQEGASDKLFGALHAAVVLQLHYEASNARGRPHVVRASASLGARLFVGLIVAGGLLALLDFLLSR